MGNEVDPEKHRCHFTSSPKGWTNDELGFMSQRCFRKLQQPDEARPESSGSRSSCLSQADSRTITKLLQKVRGHHLGKEARILSKNIEHLEIENHEIKPTDLRMLGHCQWRRIFPPKPDPFYTSRNRPTVIKTLRQAEPQEYGKRDDAGNYVYSQESCKERVKEIKDQVASYESHARLKEKAKNLIMDSMTKDLWHQRIIKTSL